MMKRLLPGDGYEWSMERVSHGTALGTVASQEEDATPRTLAFLCYNSFDFPLALYLFGAVSSTLWFGCLF